MAVAPPLEDGVVAELTLAKSGFSSPLSSISLSSDQRHGVVGGRELMKVWRSVWCMSAQYLCCCMACAREIEWICFCYLLFTEYVRVAVIVLCAQYVHHNECDHQACTLQSLHALLSYHSPSTFNTFLRHVARANTTPLLWLDVVCARRLRFQTRVLVAL